ncbi:hypothetical protein MKX01_004695 [Papaver californicum]|nr:hypothetical protein MKX01_004695 [Papaver californicum]
MLLKSYTKAEDGNCGFKFGVGSRLFVSTSSDMAVIFGMQLIENGIKNKILNERHITPSTSDLFQKYNFGAGLPVIRSTEVQVAILDAIRNGKVEELFLFVVLVCRALLADKRKGAEEMTPRFARSDVRNISKAIALLGKFHCTKTQFEK